MKTMLSSPDSIKAVASPQTEYSTKAVASPHTEYAPVWVPRSPPTMAVFDGATGRPQIPMEDDFLARLARAENGEADATTPITPPLSVGKLAGAPQEGSNDAANDSISERTQSASTKPAKAVGSATAVDSGAQVSQRTKKVKAKAKPLDTSKSKLETPKSSKTPETPYSKPASSARGGAASNRGGGPGKGKAKGAPKTPAAIKEEAEEDNSDGDGEGKSKKGGSKKEVPRHRRICKSQQGGEKLGLSFIDHPRKPGIVISSLTAEGACAAHGCMVGDHIVKINGMKPNNITEAKEQLEAAWSQMASEPSKHRLKFSLGDRTQTINLAQVGQVCAAITSLNCGRVVSGGGSCRRSSAASVALLLFPCPLSQRWHADCRPRCMCSAGGRARGGRLERDACQSRVEGRQQQHT